MMTVKELLKYCKEQVEKGNGNKIVLVTDDEEANGFHPLYAQFTDDVNLIEEISEYVFLDIMDPNMIVLLG